MADSTKKTGTKTGMGTLEQIEGFCTKTVSAMNVPLLNGWMSAYFHPAEAFASEKKKADMGNIAVQVILMAIISAVAGGIASFITMSTSFNVVGSALSIPIIGMSIIVGVIAGFIGFFLVSLLYLVVAKVLGGKGSYAEQSLGLVLVSGGMILLIAPLQVLGAIPCLGIIFGFLAMAFGIYGIYSQYRMLKAVHELSQMKTIGVMLISWAVIMVVLVVITLVVGAALIGAMGLGALAGGMGGY